MSVFDDRAYQQLSVLVFNLPGKTQIHANPLGVHMGTAFSPQLAKAYRRKGSKAASLWRCCRITFGPFRSRCVCGITHALTYQQIRSCVDQSHYAGAGFNRRFQNIRNGNSFFATSSIFAVSPFIRFLLRHIIHRGNNGICILLADTQFIFIIRGQAVGGKEFCLCQRSAVSRL